MSHEHTTDTALLEPAAAEEAPVPSETELMQSQLDRLDVELLGAIRRRTALARDLGEARTRAGEPRFVHQHELMMIRRYVALGPAGADLATLLLRMARSGPA